MNDKIRQALEGFEGLVDNVTSAAVCDPTGRNRAIELMEKMEIVGPFLRSLTSDRATLLQVVAHLHDDASVREKLTVMSAWEALWDDARTITEEDWDVKASEALVPGKTYRITLTIEEIE